MRHEPARLEPNGVKVDQEGVGASAGRLGANATVTPATGELVIEVGDRSFPCRGLDVTVLRTCRSANDYDGPMGHGWLLSWHSFLWEVSEDEVAFLSQEGQIFRVTKNASGRPSP
ncbi:MAG: hypothetical protein COA65_01435 [Rhodospirillaceae bacterium]|nr:MAG: hypothetical protein COA65_01435 [Rhodospirillaceae bacterium]